MPQVTVYIRAEDLDKWRAIEKKSEFIHSALNGGLEYLAIYGQEKLNEYAKKEKLPELTVTQDAFTSKSSKKFCEHYQPKGQCTWKGCKFGRFRK